MKRITIALATVALAAAALVGLGGVASAREAEPFAAEQKRSAAAAGGDQGTEAAEHRGEVRLAAVRLYRRAEPERRLRRRDRQVVLALCVRQVEPRDLHVRHAHRPVSRR